MMRAEASVDTHNSVLKEVKRKKVLMGEDDGVNYNEFQVRGEMIDLSLHFQFV